MCSSKQPHPSHWNINTLHTYNLYCFIDWFNWQWSIIDILFPYKQEKELRSIFLFFFKFPNLPTQKRVGVVGGYVKYFSLEEGSTDEKVWKALFCTSVSSPFSSSFLSSASIIFLRTLLYSCNCLLGAVSFTSQYVSSSESRNSPFFCGTREFISVAIHIYMVTALKISCYIFWYIQPGDCFFLLPKHVAAIGFSIIKLLCRRTASLSNFL